MTLQQPNTEKKNSLSEKKNYVEVVYLKAKQPETIKFQMYSEEESLKVFQRTLNKMRMEKRDCLVVLRDDNHQLIKSERT